jgi:hypothetical protein
MIRNLESLFIEIFWDLDERHFISVGGIDRFYINKASIYKDTEEKCIFEYKTDQTEINRLVFNKFVKFMKLYTSSEVLRHQFYNLSLLYYNAPNRKGYKFSKDCEEFVAFIKHINDLIKLI